MNRLKVTATLIAVLAVFIAANMRMISAAIDSMIKTIDDMPDNREEYEAADSSSVMALHKKLQKKWHSKEFQISLSVPLDDIMSVANSIESMRIFYLEGRFADYLSERSALLNLLKRLKQYEFPNAENIL